mgnify:CR=1 FL=1
MFQARSIRRSPADRCLARSVLQVLLATCALHEGHPLLDPAAAAPRRSGSKSMIVMRVGSTSMCLQQNRQRAPRDGAKTHEQNSLRKCRHPSSCLLSVMLSFFTSTLEFRPLCSYASRRARRQIVGRALDETRFGLEVGEGLRGERAAARASRVRARGLSTN